jgi:molybdenum cofactor biosynthesis enzyme MoaA
MLKNDNATYLSKKNIRVAITPFCNFNCVYCDGPTSRTPGKPGAMEDFRRKPLNEGVISTTEMVKIIKAFNTAGFEGVTLTGGEPFVNSEWDVIVNESAKSGMSRVEVTTNGMLLNEYLKRKKHLPIGLTLLKVSLDTSDPKRFKALTRRDEFDNVIRGIKATKLDRPDLKIRANKVLLRSDMGNLINYIEFCERSGLDEITLLDLVLNNPQENTFFQKEFIPMPEVMEFLSKQKGYIFDNDQRYGCQTHLSGGLRIILKDSNLTLRFDRCEKCPIYCQEGLYTIRVATDGTITTCPDRTAKLPFIDGVSELKNGTLGNRAHELAELFLNARQMNTHREFFLKNGIVT